MTLKVALLRARSQEQPKWLQNLPENDLRNDFKSNLKRDLQTTPENDPKDQLKRRIDEAAKYIPIENLAISPQCGMASAFLGNPITFDDQRRKFALALEVAEEVWGEI